MRTEPILQADPVFRASARRSLGRLARLPLWCALVAIPYSAPPCSALAADESTLSVIPEPSKVTPERVAERQLRRWLASREPGAGLEVVRLVRALPDGAPPELVYLAFRALAEHRSERAVLDYLTELAAQPELRDPDSSASALSLTRARALLLLVTSDASHARALVRDKALGARGVDPEGHSAARDATFTHALAEPNAPSSEAEPDALRLLGASAAELARRKCAEDFVADLPAEGRVRGAERDWAQDLGARCLPTRKTQPPLARLGKMSEELALAGYRTARGRERVVWAARVASTLSAGSAPATVRLVQTWLTVGDSELRRAVAWGLGTPGERAGELGPRLALLTQAIAREEQVEVRRMLSFAVVAITEARNGASGKGANAGGRTTTAGRALLAALAQIEPDPVTSALLHDRPLVALVVQVERGDFDPELAQGLLRLRR